MREIRLLVAAGLLVLTMTAYAEVKAIPVVKKEDCTPVEGLERRLGPVRNQGDVGWCAFNSVADLITFAYYQTLQGQQASAIYFALGNGTSLNLPFTGGAAMEGMKKLWDQLDKTGVCTQRFEQSALESLESMDWLGERLQRWASLKWILNNREEKEFLYQYKILKDTFLEKIPLKKLISLMKASPYEDLWKNLATKICGPFLTFPKKKLPFVIKVPQEGPLTTVVNAQLNKGNILMLVIPTMLIADMLSLGIHGLVIVGRSWDEENQTCTYKIRNSWKDACSAYHQKYQEGCVDGYFWLDADTLNRGFGVAYIEGAEGDALFPTTGDVPAYIHIAAGENGILWAVDQEGHLLWFQMTNPSKAGRAEWAFDGKGQPLDEKVDVHWLFSAVHPGRAYLVDTTGNLYWINSLTTEYRKTFLDLPLQKKKLSGFSIPEGRLRWMQFRQLIAGTGGSLFAVQTDGTILAYRHLGYATGEDDWARGGQPIKLATMPPFYVRILGEAQEILYGVDRKNKLWFYDTKSPWKPESAVSSAMPRTPVGTWKPSNVTFPPGQWIVWAQEGTFYAFAKTGQMSVFRFKRQPAQRGHWLFLDTHLNVAPAWYLRPWPQVYP